MTKTNLAVSIRGFFEQHLVSQRGLSGHTVLAYRDAIKLLLEFTSRRHRKTCTNLTLEDLTADTIRRFLDHLEQVRHNSVPTRNVRLAAIHSFFQYLATVDPRHLVHCQSILTVPFKRRAHRIPDYLERSEIQSLFAQIDCQTLLGQRDDALLRLLYNTGMRAQELVDLDVNHLRFSRPYSVRIYGKGRKERTCPLWKETLNAVRKYLERRSVRFTDAVPLFVNVEGNRLSRFGLRYIIAHRVAEAAETSPTLLTRNVTPHTIRHYLPFLTMSGTGTPAQYFRQMREFAHDIVLTPSISPMQGKGVHREVYYRLPSSSFASAGRPSRVTYRSVCEVTE